MSYDENKPLPRVGDRIRENYGDGHVATWEHWAIVLAVLDDGNCIVTKRWCGSVKRGWDYQAIHRVTWCVMPFEIKAKRADMGKTGIPLDLEASAAVG